MARYPASMVNSLIYVSDKDPGIVRRRYRKSFRYIDASGNDIICKNELARISALGVPPAYENVWICAQPNGHIQATGIDAAQRKQYKYHADWTSSQDQAKFDSLANFGCRLPRIRRNVDAILGDRVRVSGFDKLLACAAVTRLIDHTAIRVGGRSKMSQGATTLTIKNVQLTQNRMQLRFTAKGGRRVQATLDDRKLQRILGKIHDLPGKRLFQYIGPDGAVHPLDSGDVNAWLKDISGIDVSAKIFRTWHGSVAALSAVMSDAKPSIKRACESAATTLSNTPAIARKSYVHPAIFDLINDPGKLAAFRKLPAKRRAGLTAAECRLLQLIG